MKFSYYHFTKKPSPVMTTELLDAPGYYTYPEDLKYGDREIVITVDPGTTAVGIVVGDYNKPNFITMINIRRSNNAFEPDADLFSNAFNNRFLKDFLTYNNVKRVVVESQYLDPRRGSHTYKVLSGFVRGFRAVVSGFGLKPEEISAPSWKSTFLQGYSLRDQIDLRESNKEHIVNRGRELIPRLYQFPAGDAFDAFGMMYHYYKTMHRPDGKDTIIRVTTSMPKDNRSNLHLNIGILGKTMSKDRLLHIVSNHQKMSNGQRRIYQFIPHDKMTAEENIRSLMDQNPHIYLGFTEPYAKLMPDLLEKRDEIGGPLEADDLIYIFGYRSRIM